MSLANFFDKAALGASSILKNFDPHLFAQSLEGKTVAVVFDSETAQSLEGRIALELSANLLARLYPSVAIQAIGSSAHNFRSALIKVMQQINPQINVADDAENSDICLVFGQTPLKISAPKIYVGSDGWIARISTRDNLTTGNSDNPFGSAAAACIGVANVFRFLFADQMEAADLDESLTFSLIDLDPLSHSPSNPQMGKIDLGESHLVGIGAIGNGAVWVLSKIQNLTGTLYLIDHESVELSNLQRYALAYQDGIGTAKVKLAAREWKGKLKVEPHQLRWAEYLQNRGNWRIGPVAVALDSAADRCAVQSALPKYVLNSWTRGGNLGISRHFFLSEQACLVCLYLPEGRKKNEDELIAEAIGLPKAVREIRQLLHQNSPVNAQFLNRVAEAFHADPSALMPFQGKTIRSFYTEAVCGGVLLRLGTGNTGTVEVPMAFQSVLAGILLAAELVVESSKLRASRLPTITQIDLLKPMGKFLSVPATKDSRQRCICQDEDYISVFQQKYSNVKS